MADYTVQNIMPTDKPEGEYGQEYAVTFKETGAETFFLYYKTRVPAQGDVIQGHIEDTKWGRKFKKEKQPYNPGGSTPPVGPKKSYAAVQDNKSDGMRQGMCFNNAATYVAQVAGDKTLAPTEWANAVHAYATALYRRGDLTMEAPAAPVKDEVIQPTEQQEKNGLTAEDLSTIDTLFPGL